jgi:hypothetical protein
MLIVPASSAEARFRTLEVTATLSIDSVAFRRMMERSVEEHHQMFLQPDAGRVTNVRFRRRQHRLDVTSR